MDANTAHLRGPTSVNTMGLNPGFKAGEEDCNWKSSFPGAMKSGVHPLSSPGFFGKKTPRKRGNRMPENHAQSNEGNPRENKI